MGQIALQMYTLREFMNTREDYFETLKKVQAIGYQSLQTKCPAFMTREEFKDTLASFGFEVDSVSAKLTQIEEDPAKAAEEADFLGVKAVRVEAMPQTYSNTEEGVVKYAAMLESAGRKLTGEGKKLIYHFHAFEWLRFADGRRAIDILLNETTSENVWFQPDIFWLTAAGTEPSESLALFAGRAEWMHVKDYAIKPRQEGVKETIPWTSTPVGEGNISWKRVLKTSEEIGIKRFVVEQDWCAGDPFDCVKRSFETMKRFGLRP